MRFERDDARVGLLVIVAALLFGALLFTKTLSTMARKERPLRLHLDDVSDLTVGTEVKLQGLRVGQVDAVDLFREGPRYRFEARVGLRKDILLWEGTRALVTSKLLGGAFVDLQLPPPEGRRAPLPDNAVLEAKTGSSLAALIEGANDLFKNLNAILGELQAQVKQHGVGVLLDNPDLKKVLKGVDATLTEFRTLAQEGQVAVRHGDEGMQQTLASAEKSLGVLQKLLTTRSGELDAILVNMDATMKELKGLSAEANGLVKANAPEAEATLKALRRNLESTEELLEILKAKPNRVVFGTPSEQEKASAREKVESQRKKAAEPAKDTPK